MHEIIISHPLLAFLADDLLASLFGLSIRIAVGKFPRNKLIPAKMLAEVLGDNGRLGKRDLLLPRTFERNYGRFAEGMDLFEFGRREEIGLAFEGLEVVG